MQWDISTMRVFVGHKTDEDSQTKDKYISGFVTDEDPKGQSVLLQYTPCYVIAQQHPYSVYRHSDGIQLEV